MNPVAPDLPSEPPRNGSRIGLGGRIVGVLLTAALLPLALTGIGAWVVFGRLLEDKALELHRTVVASHARAIDLYLAERTRALELVSRCLTLADAGEPAVLRRLFDVFNESYDHAFVDLGVIDAEGRHLNYVGPFPLQDRNYAEADWFRSALARGAFVSDVFLGYRGVPHCVIAVRRQEGAREWILRATINSDRLDALVQTGELGETGEAFLVNAAGIYQTPPREGRVLEASPLPAPEAHRGLRERRLQLGGRERVQTSRWLQNVPWLLVVQQDAAEIAAPVRRAMLGGLLVVLLAVALLVIATVLATRHLTDRIAEANRRARALSRDLLRSAKLASLGELATGLAHEINNPLAILSAEQTNIGDLIDELRGAGPQADEIRESVRRTRRQIDRCGAITAKMLQFGRQDGAGRAATAIGPRLTEVVELMRRQAAVRNVALELQVAGELPPALLDPTELEQVLVNLITNSLQAIDGAGWIAIRAERELGGVRITVQDSGAGIAPADLERVFQPFFTTKPVGQGTGLGLSVCYGIVRSWGGRIEVESEAGQGTTFTLHLLGAAGAGAAMVTGATG